MNILKYGAAAWLTIDMIAVIMLCHASKHAPCVDENENIIPDNAVIDLTGDDVIIYLRDDQMEVVAL